VLGPLQAFDQLRATANPFGSQRQPPSWTRCRTRRARSAAGRLDGAPNGQRLNAVKPEALADRAASSQTAYPLTRICPAARSTLPGAQIWSVLTQEYSGWEVVSVTFCRNCRIGGQRDLLAALGGDLGVDVERGAAVGANVKVVHALDGPAQLCPGDRALGPRSTRQSARLRPAAEPAPTSDIRASIDTPYSTPCVIIGAYS